MSKRKLEAKAWLKEVGVPDDHIEEMASRLSAAQMEKIAEGYMRQDDYDSTMNTGKAEIAKAQEDLAAANQRLTLEMAEWGTLTNAEKANNERLRADLEVAQSEALRTRQVLTRLGQEHGIDVSKVLEGQVTKPTEPVAPAFDASKFVSPDQLSQSQVSLANMILTFPAELAALQLEHQQLFGKPLDPRSIVTELQSRATNKTNQKSLDPRAIWEEQHKVGDARQAAEKKRWDDMEKAAEQRGRESAISESSIPGQVTSPGKHSIVFSQNRESAIKRPQPMDTVSRAAAALRTHKYHPDVVAANGGKPAA